MTAALPGGRSRVAGRVALAVLAGLVLSASLALVLGQQGALAPQAMLVTAATTLVAVAVVALVPWPPRVAKGVVVASWLATIAAFGVALAPPAAAQAPCEVQVTVDGVTRDLLATSDDAPLTLRLDTTEEVAVSARARGLDGAVVAVELVETVPPVPGVAVDDVLLFFGQIEDGEASSTLRVVADGPTGFALEEDTLGRLPVPPLGQARFAVRTRVAGTATPSCLDGEVVVRFVAAPASNWPGRAGMAGLVLGTALLHAAVRLGAASTAGRDGRPTAAPPPSASKPEPPAPQLVGDPVPARGAWHVPRVETRILDVDGRPVAPDQPLVPGGSYTLAVTLDSPLGPRPTLGDDAVHVVGDHDGVPFTVTWGPDGTATIPLAVQQAGVATTAIDLVFRGHLLQTERLSLVVGDVAEAPGHATRTVFSASDLTADDLDRREPRALLVIVEPAGNGAVWARVVTPDGAQLPLREDGPNRPVPLAAVNEAVDRARTALHAIVEDDESTDRLLLRRDLAAVGRRLHRALLATTPASVALLREHVTDGVVVQVVQDAAGMGWATVPWQLLYDLPLDAGAPELVPCPHEPHGVDACPSVLADGVVCTTGFWGLRAVVEEPHPTSATDVELQARERPTTIATTVDGAGCAYVSPQLPGADESREAVADLGLRLLSGRDDLLAALADPATGLLYAYGHHGIAAPTGEEGFQLGDAWLLPDDLFDRGIEAAGRPVVLLNGCGTGAGALTSLATLPDALCWAGCAAVVASETTLYAPTAGVHGEALLADVLGGEALGPALLQLRRSVLAHDGVLAALAYRLHGASETRVRRVVDVAAAERAAAGDGVLVNAPGGPVALDLGAPDPTERVDVRPPRPTP